jgi:hypothetical protein
LQIKTCTDNELIRSTKIWHCNECSNVSKDLRKDSLAYFKHLNRLTFIEYEKQVLHFIFRRTILLVSYNHMITIFFWCHV